MRSPLCAAVGSETMTLSTNSTSTKAMPHQPPLLRRVPAQATCSHPLALLARRALIALDVCRDHGAPAWGGGGPFLWPGAIPTRPARGLARLVASPAALLEGGRRHRGPVGCCRPALIQLRIAAQHWRPPSSATKPLASTAAYCASSTSACSSAPAATQRPGVQAAWWSAAFCPPGATLARLSR